MKRLFRLAARLYPAWWRRRYAEEFEALLDDMNPGWRGLFDVVKGALAMQIATLGTIPVVCALAGAMVGGVIAARTPEVFAASSRVQLIAGDNTKAQLPTAQELQASMIKAGSGLGATVRATSVKVLGRGSSQPTMIVTHRDRDEAKARLVVEVLTVVAVSNLQDRTAWSEARVYPVFATASSKPAYPMAIASGGGLGLVAGGVVFLLLRRWRRSGSAG